MTAFRTQASVRRAVLTGARAMLPLLAALAPLGLVVGAAAAEADLPAGAGLATGVVIYSASAQLAAIDLLDRGMPVLVVVLAVLIINARLGLYSAAMGARWVGTPRWWRALAAYLLVDPSYVVGLEGYTADRPRSERHAHYLGAGLTLWVGWQVLAALGFLLGGRLPAGLNLSFAAPLCLLAMVAQRVEGDRPAGTAAVVAAAVAVAGHGLPLATGLPLAILAGIALGARRS